MKIKTKILSIILLLCIISCSLFGCTQPCEIHVDADGDRVCDVCGEKLPALCDTHTDANSDGICDVCYAQVSEVKDYASMVSMSDSTLKAEVTVKLFIDGDTTHFNVPTSILSSGVLKGRYLAINTPESTGKIEQYGKKAAAFTQAKLSSAVSIYIESDDDKLNPDSTGERYMIWVWYKTADSDTYRNLNIEILQNGLAIASSTASNRYGTTAVAALEQGKAQKLNCYSGVKDPDYYAGDVVELTLKELRCNIADYDGIRVAFNAVVTMHSDGSIYVESYDAETEMYYGISVFYGYGLNGTGLSILSVGNMVRIVGVVSYWPAGGTYQITDINYRDMKPDDIKNIKKISDGHEAAYTLITGTEFTEGTVTISQENEDGEIEDVLFDLADLILDTTVSMENLTVESIYTTTAESSDDKGAMTITCKSSDNKTVVIRTGVLRDTNGDLITESAYLGKIINVKGVVELFNEEYQIKVLAPEQITILN